MTTGMVIARDTEGFRVEMDEEDDARILFDMGRWSFELNGDAFTVRPDTKGTAVCFYKGTEGGRPSIRFVDFNMGYGMGVKRGRFGPVHVEVDISDPDGWGADLPALHERPWPRLTRNEGYYDPWEQLLMSLAERIISLIDATDMSVNDAIKSMTGKEKNGVIPLPDRLRDFMPRGNDTKEIVKKMMASLRSTAGSA